MTDVNLQNNMYRKAISKVDFMLQIIGLSLYYERKDCKSEGLKYRWPFCLNLFCICLNIFSQMLWLVHSSYNGTLSLVKLTYVSPCLTMCALGCVKTSFFIKNSKAVNKLVKTFNILYSTVPNLGMEDKKTTETYMLSNVRVVDKAINVLAAANVLGIIAFSVGPIVVILSQYYSKGVLELIYPFQLLYPFNAYDIRVWPFVYIYQIWSAIIAVFSVLGPDSLFNTSCVLLNVKFFQLKMEIEAVFDQEENIGSDDDVRSKLSSIINRHQQLLSSVNLIESMYSKSTLFNILTSSFLICCTGFNVMAYDNILIMTPFIAFLFTVIGQIFVLCYYGDLIQIASGELSDGVYNSIWYKEKVAVVQNLMIISTRAQKPCILRACGFVDVNIQAFTKIMSTAWSYFAVLLSIHKNN